MVILMYHAFGGPGEPASRFVVPVRRFEAQLRWIRRLGYRVISLEAYLHDRRAGRPSAPRSVILTIDDGYADTHTLAYPLLRRHGFQATIFLVSDGVAGANTWDDAGPLAGRPLLPWTQVRDLQAGGFHFGAHTRTHPHLTEVPRAAAEAEIVGSREALERVLSAPVTTFAYPYGRHDAWVRAAVERAGYLGACTTDDGINAPSTPSLALRRCEVEGTDRWLRFVVALWTGSGRWWPRRRDRR